MQQQQQQLGLRQLLSQAPVEPRGENSALQDSGAEPSGYQRHRPLAPWTPPARPARCSCSACSGYLGLAAGGWRAPPGGGRGAARPCASVSRTGCSSGRTAPTGGSQRCPPTSASSPPTCKWPPPLWGRGGWGPAAGARPLAARVGSEAPPGSCLRGGCSAWRRPMVHLGRRRRAAPLQRLPQESAVRAQLCLPSLR